MGRAAAGSTSRILFASGNNPGWLCSSLALYRGLSSLLKLFQTWIDAVGLGLETLGKPSPVYRHRAVRSSAFLCATVWSLQSSERSDEARWSCRLFSDEPRVGLL